MNSDDVAVLDSQVVSHNSVDTSATVIEIIVGQHDKHSILALLALDQDSITAEELESLHGVIRESNHGVVIVRSIGHTIDELSASSPQTRRDGPSMEILTSTSWASSSS